MSSVPPNMPPGGGQPPYPPYPPYDPKAQYRAYREQQKAAWHAQRDAWKAQQHAWKANYANTYGLRVPSMVGPILLIGIGVVALLIITGHLGSVPFWTWYSHWWPLLLIGAGLAMLGEWALDMRRHTPIRRTGSFIGVLVLLVIVGLGASAWKHAWGPLRAQFGDEGDDFFNSFGLPEHDADQEILSAQIPANSSVEIQNPRGDISVTSGDGQTIQVQAHQVAYASSDNEANKIYAAEAAHLNVSGSSVLVKSDGSSSGRLNITVTVPHNAHVTINSGRGDVTVAALGSGLSINAVHGDTHLNNIAGGVQVHFGSNKHDFSVHQVEGDVIADGNSNDVTLSEVKGRISINGEIFGEVHMENIGGPINLRTSVTDLQIASLPGDLTLNSDDLRVTESKGMVHVVTRSKDVDISQLQGDCYVEDRDGRIAVEPSGNFNIEAKNSKGDIELTLPPNASATVNGHTRNGDIVTEFALATSGDESKTITGRIGGGQARISLSTDNGDLRLKRGSSVPSVPALPATASHVPAAPHAPHLKGSQRELQQKPVTQ
jgi:DUF4097 and DUF4098 domain-containing protein YvlB